MNWKDVSVWAFTRSVIENIVPDWNERSIQKGLVSTGSLVSFLLLWYVGSVIVPDAIPAPDIVFGYTFEAITSAGPRGETGFDHLLTSLSRVAVIGAISLTATLAIGIMMGLNETVEDVVSMWLPLWMTTPDIIALLFFMILMGFQGISVIVVVSIFATPFGIVNIWEGIQDLDRELIEMGQTFEAGTVTMWRHVYLPHLLPYVFASSRYLLGQIWKLVLVGEAIGLNTGMGSIVRLWFTLGEITPIIAYLVLFMVVVLGIEYIVLKPLEHHFFRWRPE